MRFVSCILLGVALFTGACSTYQDDQSRRSKMAQFALNHPIAAKVIGVESQGLVNISSNAARFVRHSGLAGFDREYDRGTRANALRNALWQAAVAARFGGEIAEKAGNANLIDMDFRAGKADYYSLLLADQAVDQRNNRIGRDLGRLFPDADMKTLAEHMLLHYRREGLWVVREVWSGERKVWHIEIYRLDEDEYRAALAAFAVLDENGMDAAQRTAYAENALDGLKETVKVLKQVED